MKRLPALLYGLIAYAIFLFAFVYAIGFVGNLVVPRSIDSHQAGSFWPSLAINLGLLGLFAVQHSVMARPRFKTWWTRIVPEPIERSTYVLFASLALLLLYWQWRPMPEVVWSVDYQLGRAMLWLLFGLGWTLVLVATFMISHAHLFGVQQVHSFWRGRKAPGPGFQTPGLYRHMRHPIMVGFFVAFWATPVMTAGHLVFALATTGYILIALQLEERDLIRAFGDRYEAYRREVPMFFPGLRRNAAAKEPVHERV